MQTKSLMRKWLAITIVVLFVGTSITALVEPSNAIFTITKSITGFHESSRDQIELKYYDPNTLNNDFGMAEPPPVWKDAIRLTQTELAPYNTWNLTQVVIGFGEDPSEGPINVRIYVYGKGVATHPGSIIVNDTTVELNGTALITVPLVTSVSLTGRDEIWVAVEWFQNGDINYHTFVDAGPAVDGKGDWMFINNDWFEIQHGGADSNWAIGAVVEGQGLATLGIINIKGPLGVKANIQNTGDADAQNVAWSMTVKGGILGLVNKSSIGSKETLIAHNTLSISVPLFIGFGKISIQISVEAMNAVEITETKSAFLLGPFVIGIR